ncbi:peptidase inhibitor family I36 protein [Streptomyces triticirhizae]|uniref:Peptidase inhibitor family I36 n=1 Tax=Streptomyces triticirhizae TaxID=2483353 RepID=A0A3M2M1E6_9ACTN|nr:peptidase inhibitor family I36 protein [Streptomyces triticirhizae]RMI43262.1 hypothetical protein EBN88_07660 [Streptomyces triticirhizae]RMI44789.1 hypothetical protein EBN88_04660 [Streptomyces triticirhizae]
MRFRRTVGAAGAALAVAATTLTLAPSASAAKADCPRGYVCVWDTPSFEGEPTRMSQGDIETNLTSNTGIRIYNNGVHHQNADHIWYRVTKGDGEVVEGCPHYPPDTPNYRTVSGPVTFEWARWGGEC